MRASGSDEGRVWYEGTGFEGLGCVRKAQPASREKGTEVATVGG